MTVSKRRHCWLSTTALIGSIAVLMGAGVASAQDRTATYAIQDESLASALRDYARISGTQILFTEDLVKGRMAPPLKGTYAASAALDQLLAGSGLAAERTSTGGVLIVRADQHPQDHAAASPAADKNDVIVDLVVTGSHIRGIRPISPVQTVSREDMDQSGYSQVGDLVRSLPVTFGGGQNPGIQRTGGTVSQNVSGASTVNLRGLGPAATLVLLDGHRLVADANSAAPDISGIPVGAIERVEIVTDGASALYGTDAVAGVVNFILRKDYEGAEASATIGGATQGGGFEQDYNSLFGKTWSTGHAFASVEYLHQDSILASQRDFTSAVPPVLTLLGGNLRISTFANAEQALTDWASFHIDSLYTTRESGQQYVYGVIGYNYALKSSSYNIDPGLDFNLPGGWKASVNGLISEAADKEPGISSSGVRSNTSVRNSTDSIEATLSGSLLSLPTGTLRVAAGGGYREENFFVALTSAVGEFSDSRNVSYLYGEILAPLVTPADDRLGLEKLDLSLAGRIENYSDFGTTSNPKLGLRYVPFGGFTLRCTWGTSFKAPSLYQLSVPQIAYLYKASTLGASGSGYALLDFGGNPDLKPERAKSWTSGFDWSPPSLKAFSLSATYFNIDYTDRILYPITVLGQALSNSFYAPYVTQNPTAAQQSSVISDAFLFYTNTAGGAAYDPSTTLYLINDRYTNAVAQKIDGVDASIKDSFSVIRGRINLFATATWLRVTQQNTSTAPTAILTGTLFEPSKARVRSGLNWSVDGISATGILNYMSGETDTGVTPNVHVASWTTLDVNLSYDPPLRTGILAGVRTSLAITNALDKDPPYAKGAGAAAGAKGVYFDSTNASAIGRFISLTIRKKF